MTKDIGQGTLEAGEGMGILSEESVNNFLFMFQIQENMAHKEQIINRNWKCLGLITFSQITPFQQCACFFPHFINPK